MDTQKHFLYYLSWIPIKSTTFWKPALCASAFMEHTSSFSWLSYSFELGAPSSLYQIIIGRALLSLPWYLEPNGHPCARIAFRCGENLAYQGLSFSLFLMQLHYLHFVLCFESYFYINSISSSSLSYCWPEPLQFFSILCFSSKLGQWRASLEHWGRVEEAF